VRRRQEIKKQEHQPKSEGAQRRRLGEARQDNCAEDHAARQKITRQPLGAEAVDGCEWRNMVRRADDRIDDIG
jgi:hypothetical protein